MKLWKYKMNYGVKALAAFMIYNSYQNYCVADEENFLTETQRSMHRVNILLGGAGLTGLCLLI